MNPRNPSEFTRSPGWRLKASLEFSARIASAGGIDQSANAFELSARSSSVFAPRAVRVCARSNGQGKQSQHLMECCLSAWSLAGGKQIPTCSPRTTASAKVAKSLCVLPGDGDGERSLDQWEPLPDGALQEPRKPFRVLECQAVDLEKEPQILLMPRRGPRFPLSQQESFAIRGIRPRNCASKVELFARSNMRQGLGDPSIAPWSQKNRGAFEGSYQWPWPMVATKGRQGHCSGCSRRLRRVALPADLILEPLSS